MFFVDLNMRCPKRCAKPLRRSGSSFEPTLYQTWMETVGLERSCAVMTTSPFESVRSLKLMGGTRVCALRPVAPAAESAHTSRKTAVRRSISEAPRLYSVRAPSRPARESRAGACFDALPPRDCCTFQRPPGRGGGAAILSIQAIVYAPAPPYVSR